MSGRPFRIDFIADLCCPWCYVGWRALDQALVARTDLAPTRHWGPYFLRPDTPPFGFDRADYMRKLFDGAPERARASRDALLAAAADAGATLNIDAAKVMPNTMDAHRLIHWATGQGLMAAAVDALFEAYFVDGRNIGDRDELVALASSIGLDAVVVKDLLAGESDWTMLANAHNAAVEAGVRGVPVTIMDGRRAHQGAETVAGYGRLIDAALAA